MSVKNCLILTLILNKNKLKKDQNPNVRPQSIKITRRISGKIFQNMSKDNLFCFSMRP